MTNEKSKKAESSEVILKRKIDEESVGKRPNDESQSSSSSSSNDSFDNKKVKKSDDFSSKPSQPSTSLKTSKIQLKLSSASTFSKSNVPDKKISVEAAKVETSVTNKLPGGNLAPSKAQPIAVVKNVSEKVAKVFGSDDDEDEGEEMPMEAKMKMRNLGRNTPTSTGPNSYGKSNLGFCDHRKLFEKQLKEKADQLLKDEETPRSSFKK